MHFLSAASKPDLSFLTLFKWKDGQGVVQRLRIIKKVSAEWRELGRLIGFGAADLRRIDRLEHLDNVECCVDVFNHWIDNDGHPTNYPLTWQGLYDLLCDIEHDTVASYMKMALVSRGVSIL